ncbi:class I adenylate-forming enzyme family protein [Actinophytocola algeriensis]|uniref:Acyl-CoA synthetase (AMP-forming)/AMP-acid ligase II n=1 Tax=Actinophytocola algeriensis TaxID=1768010 RepID=A0A7W7VHL9_9PSEU|nr:class I adenylate-forming enzyme family protein [Actinophytocola algeriensis]MBB4910647.1 acyl-CoA synthetase (AMP-forming)/AMP-acid ligase II [Actinophytocola algeriensis]MBE1473640.1 acyl-CoA synthetase (AMP-forming)/AMP-acid ligase II [Actinophytocola algeriensis]
MILHDALTRGLTDHPDSLVGNLGTTLTYRQVLAAAEVRSEALLDTLPGDTDGPPRVAISRRNSPAYVSDLLAVLAVGGVPILLDPLLGAAELAELFTSCDVDAALHDSATALSVEHGTVTDCAGSAVWRPEHRGRRRPPLHPDTEICRLSSGSTRSPACIEFSGAAVLAASRAWLAASTLGPADRVLCFAGLYNGLAFNTSLVPGLLAGADVFVPSGLPSPGNVARHLVALDPTVLVAFPAAYDAIAASSNDVAAPVSLRLALSSAARLDPATSTALARRSIHIADYYGIAETGPLTFNADPAPGGGQGYPLPGVTLRTGEREDGVGVLLARSASMGTRYLNYPGEFEARVDGAGFYRTSDRGSLDDDGRLRLAGRVDNSLDVGGRKFAADEVVDVLNAHSEVTDSAVALVSGRDRPVLGAVVVRSGPVDATDLRRFCLTRTAPYKVPERIVFVDELPRSGAGKVQLGKVKAILSAGVRGGTKGEELDV